MNSLEDFKSTTAEENAASLSTLRKEIAAKLLTLADEANKKSIEHSSAVNSHSNHLRDTHEDHTRQRNELIGTWTSSVKGIQESKDKESKQNGIDLDNLKQKNVTRVKQL